MKSLRLTGLVLGSLLFVATSALCSGAVTDQQAAIQNLILKKDYSGAVRLVAAAIDKNPTDGALYLQQGDLFEVLGQNEDARKTFQAGIKAATSSDPLRDRLAYRLALVTAMKLADPKTAARIAADLPPGSLEKIDASGALALSENNAGKALPLFDEALQKAPNDDQAARVHYHASLAHHRSGDLDKALAALFNAINKAENLALRKDIEALWVELYALQRKSAPR